MIFLGLRGAPFQLTAIQWDFELGSNWTVLTVAPGADRVHVSEAGLVVQGFVGQQGSTRADAVAAIEVRRRTPSGGETKRSPHPRIWQVTVRGRSDDATVVRFRLVSHEEATRLAARIGEILGRPVIQREGLAR